MRSVAQDSRSDLCCDIGTKISPVFALVVKAACTEPLAARCDKFVAQFAVRGVEGCSRLLEKTIRRTL
jgi:hypothetical protein